MNKGDHMDRFSKTCLVLIVTFMAVVALRPILMPAPVHAQQTTKKTYQYDFLTTMDEPESFNDNFSQRFAKTRSRLNELSAQGWEVIAVGPDGTQGDLTFVLRK
jgi:hypothetical protein